MSAVIEFQNITKRFPGVLALDDVSLEVRPNEVVGLIGENGAGKSTLLKILSGSYQADSGTLRVRGEPVRFRGPADAVRAGIGMVYQEQSLIGSVTVAENIFLGFEGESVRGGVYRWSNLRERAVRQLVKVKSDIDPRAVTDRLSFADRQMVEIAKALAVEELSAHPPVIILDEPTSVLEGRDLDKLFEQVERLRKYGSVIFVSHRLDEVLRVSDRVYVLKDGQVVAGMPADAVEKRDLHRLMVGRDSSNEFYREDEQQSVDSQPVIFEVAGLSKKGRFDQISLTVRAGEVLGLAGVGGSGREDLCRVFVGAESCDAGSMTLDGSRFSPRGPADAVSAGFGYVPAERKIEGAVLGMSVAENMIMADPSTVSRFGFLNVRQIRTVVNMWIEQLRIRTPTQETDIASLSGGNQQKVVLARWLQSPRLRVLVLDHPTRGLDVGAKEDVYQFIRMACRRGLAVILLADSLDETIGLSHRVAVLRDGRITAEFDSPPESKPSQVDIVKAMV